MSLRPGRAILIGTHHKTGTVWTRELFSRIAELLEVPFLRLGPHEEIDLAKLRRDHRLTILFQDHACFASLPLLAADRGAHVIRDPRDVLISAANYHGWSHEPWLHEARKSLRGRTYQQSISELDFDDAIRFEMQRSGGLCIGEMLSLDRGDLFADVRLEDLMLATRGQAAAWFSTLGFVGTEVEECVDAFEASRLRQDPEVGLGLRQHVQNPDLYQWRYMFGPDLLASFREHFGDAAERLGYLPSAPEMLIDDEPRRQAHLARFIGNRGRLAEARALVEASLERSPDHRQLLLARAALADASASER
jgi:hypothetical protein